MRLEKAYYWPGWLIDSCHKTLKIKKQKQTFGQMQICLWRALNIYDDFLDGAGLPQDLPIGNGYFRTFLKTLYSANTSKNFLTWAETTLSDLELANQEEANDNKLDIKNQEIIIPRILPKFNNLKHLSRKSLPLAIAPALILESNQLIPNTKFLNRLNSFFQYTLAAKQLSDDAKDWLDDLKQGKITAVNVLILKAAQSKNITLNLQKNLEVIYLLFITAAAERTCFNIISLCKKARQNAEKIGIANHSPIIVNIIEPLETACERAINFKKML